MMSEEDVSQPERAGGVGGMIFRESFEEGRVDEEYREFVVIVSTHLQEVNLLAGEIVNATEFGEESSGGLLGQLGFLAVIFPVGHCDPEGRETESREEHDSPASQRDGVVHVLGDGPEGIRIGEDDGVHNWIAILGELGPGR